MFFVCLIKYHKHKASFFLKTKWNFSAYSSFGFYYKIWESDARWQYYRFSFWRITFIETNINSICVLMRLNVFYDQCFHCADINIIPLTDLGDGETFCCTEQTVVLPFFFLSSHLFMLHTRNCLLHYMGLSDLVNYSCYRYV